MACIPLNFHPLSTQLLLSALIVSFAVEGTGEYRLVAGSICLAGSWRLADKLGKTLSEIHVDGQVYVQGSIRIANPLHNRPGRGIKTNFNFPWSGEFV